MIDKFSKPAQEQSALTFLKDLFSSDLREQQLATVSEEDESLSETTINESEQVNDNYLQVTLGTLGVAAAGALFSPLLSLAAIPGLLYITWPALQESYEALVKEHRFRAVHVNTTVAVGLLLTGQYFACALAYSFIMLARQLLLKVEDHSLSKTINLFGNQSRFVWRVSDGIEIQVPFDQVQQGDIIVAYAGEMIPVDGTIHHGMASIDQSMLTGEAQPVEKEAGDTVLASTIVISGQLQIQVEKAGSETVASQITTVLNQTINFKEQLHWQWMEWIDDTAWITLLAGLISYPFIGFAGAITMIYAAGFGYTMRIVAPLTLMSYLNLTSQQRILIKDGRSLEILKQVDTVVFDKTGTLTNEVPTLARLIPVNGYTESELLTYAAAAEYKQTHPIALAILQEAARQALTLPTIEDTHYQIGYGLTVQMEDVIIQVGSMRFMGLEGIDIPAQIEDIQASSDNLGHSLVYVAINQELGGIIELMPTIRPEAKEIINNLRRRGMDLYIISGDQREPTQKLADALGIDHFFAEVLPEDKASLIKSLQAEGRTVCFVGDGINDSIALKTANLSISLSGATSVAMDSAQIILMDGTLRQLDKLFTIAHEFDQNIRKSYITSLIPTILSIAGIFLLNIGIITSVLLYYGGLALGINNAMQPLLQAQKPKLLEQTKAFKSAKKPNKILSDAKYSLSGVFSSFSQTRPSQSRKRPRLGDALASHQN